jgi:predicted helicase
MNGGHAPTAAQPGSKRLERDKGGSRATQNIRHMRRKPCQYSPTWAICNRLRTLLGEVGNNCRELAGAVSPSAITKDAVFAYCYAVLHDPLYREKYALNLKREFPRIPFYPDFAQWAAWGEALMALDRSRWTDSA